MPMHSIDKHYLGIIMYSAEADTESKKLSRWQLCKVIRKAVCPPSTSNHHATLLTIPERIPNYPNRNPKPSLCTLSSIHPTLS